jgi:phospholipid transport system substrate-binding protein
MRLFLNLVCLTTALFVQAAAAQELAPDALVKSVTDDVIAAIKQDKDIRGGNARKTIMLVEQKVLPHFDFTRMTALAVGANWRAASPEQQKQLVDEFDARAPIRRRHAHRDQVVEAGAARAVHRREAVALKEQPART